MKDTLAVIGFFTVAYLLLAAIGWVGSIIPVWLGNTLTIAALFAPIVGLIVWVRKLIREGR